MNHNMGLIQLKVTSQMKQNDDEYASSIKKLEHALQLSDREYELFFLSNKTYDLVLCRSFAFILIIFLLFDLFILGFSFHLHWVWSMITSLKAMQSHLTLMTYGIELWISQNQNGHNFYQVFHLSLLVYHWFFLRKLCRTNYYRCILLWFQWQKWRKEQYSTTRRAKASKIWKSE